MLNDTNRTGVFTPNGFGFNEARNLVGSGSDGRTYWNVFNFEGESSSPAEVITYATLADMLSDINRTGDFTPNGFGFNEARNLVGSGADIARTTAVPEPSSLPLICVSLLGFGLLLRIKRSSCVERVSAA